MSDAIRRAAEVIAPEGVIEVRALAESAVHSGYFDDRTELAERAAVLDADPSVGGIYVTLNPVNPALLARRANRIKMRLGKKDATTADADILRRRWLPVDIDPVRPSGVSSTDDEHDLALTTAERIAAWLGEQGFPDAGQGRLGERGAPPLPDRSSERRGGDRSGQELPRDPRRPLLERAGHRRYRELQRRPDLETLRHGLAEGRQHPGAAAPAGEAPRGS